MLMNFRQASSTVDQRKEKLDALNTDLLGILTKEGIGGLQARTAFQYKMARLFRETVMDGFAMTDPTPIFTERREGELGNTYEYEKLINTFRVVKYAPGSDPQVFTPRKGKYTITTASYELPVGIDLQKILTRQHSVATFANMSAEAITRHYVSLVLTAIDTACATGSVDIRGRDLRENVGGADVTQDAIDDQLRRMYASGANDVTIFAHRYALDPIFDFGANTDASKDELRARGELGTYRGARMVAVMDEHNVYNDSFTSINGVDWENLLFLANTSMPGAILLERDLSALNWQETDAEKAWFRTGVRWDHGILVHSNWRYGVIELT